MSREPIPTNFFVLTAIRCENQYLLVHEYKHGQLWYLPAGRVEPGERFIEAAKRETLEEAGIPIELDGLIRIEHSPFLYETRVRLIFTGHPIDNTPPKSKPDQESLEAGWFTLEQIQKMDLRDVEVLHIFSYLEAGGTVAPLAMLTSEGYPFPHCDSTH